MYFGSSGFPTHQSLHQIPGQNYSKHKVARTLLWPKIIIGVGICTSVLMYTFYSKHYQAENQSGQSGLALTGDTLLAIFYSLVMTLGGIFVGGKFATTTLMVSPDKDKTALTKAS